MFQRALLLGLLALGLAGCGPGSSLFTPSTGTVTGHVNVRACGGANREGLNGCPTQPVTGARLTFHLIGSSGSSTVTTDATGAYRLDLKPGGYRVDVGAVAPFSRFGGPGQVTVTAGKTVTADFTFTIELL